MKVKLLTKTSIFLIFSVLVVGMIFSTDNVEATSYYNWIQNPSFNTYTEYVNDGSFESNVENLTGTIGNWTHSHDDIAITTDNPNTGIYCLVLSPYYAGGATTAYYTLNSGYQVLGADVINASVYARSDDSIVIWVEYTDSSDDSNTYACDGESTWKLIDFTSLIDDSKNIEYISFRDDDGDSQNQFIDDFSLLVDDGEGQDDIVFGGNDFWQLGGTYSSVAPYFGHLNTVLGRIDNSSCQMDSPSETYKIIQYVDFLDSDTINYANVYVYGANVSDGEGVKMKLLYSDGSTDEKTVYATGNGSDWEELNFGQSWVDSNKYITLVYLFPVFDGEAGSFNIDDVGLWSSIPYGYSKFAFTISPQPIEKGSYDFDAYSETTYTFNGYFYNVTDMTLSINGTYQIGDSFGLHNGTMTNGYFSLQLSKRTYTGSPYTLETLSVTIITNEEIFNVDITAYWYPVSGGVSPDAYETDTLTNWTILGITLLVPSFMFAGIGSSINPIMGMIGFIGGLTLMGCITLSIGMVDLWFLFGILIVDVLVILGLSKSGRM